MLADILQAIAAGINPETYFETLSLGGEHDAVITLASRCVRFGDIKKALAVCGDLTELLSITDPGGSRISVHVYLKARAAGATPDELHAANAVGTNMVAYSTVRSVPQVTHEEALDATQRWPYLDLDDYAGARRKGAAHAELMATAEIGISMYAAGIATEDGITLAELTAASTTDPNDPNRAVLSYIATRQESKITGDPYI
jgi:hypothetical protein